MFKIFQNMTFVAVRKIPCITISDVPKGPDLEFVMQTKPTYLCPMGDVHSKEIRSKNMAAIKAKNTKPEMLVRKFLHANGYRYKLHDKNLPGKPDIIN